MLYYPSLPFIKSKHHINLSQTCWQDSWGWYLLHPWCCSSIHSAILCWDVLHPSKCVCTSSHWSSFSSCKQLQLLTCSLENTQTMFSGQMFTRMAAVPYSGYFLLGFFFFRSWILLNSVLWKSSSTSVFLPDEMLGTSCHLRHCNYHIKLQMSC